MMNLEFSRLLRYLATGEDKPLVLALLGDEPGAAAMLARARTALQLLGPETLNPAVRRRLKAATRASSGPPPMPSPKESRFGAPARSVRRSPPAAAAPESRIESAAWAPLMERSGSASASAGSRRPTAGSRFARSIRAGAREFESLGPLLLDRGSPRPIQVEEPAGDVLDAEISARVADREATGYMAADIIKFPFRDRNRRQAKAEADACRVDVPGGGALLFRHNVRNASHLLSVQLEGKPVTGGPVQVTWLPEQGDVCQVFTDGSGEATLPWPAVGDGILRVDAARTLECKILVRL